MNPEEKEMLLVNGSSVSPTDCPSLVLLNPHYDHKDKSIPNQILHLAQNQDICVLHGLLINYKLKDWLSTIPKPSEQWHT